MSRAVSPRSTLPVLSNILVATDEGRLRLSATNLELGITCWIGAKIEEDGSTTVPARTFTDLISTIPPAKTDISLHEPTQTLNIKSGSLNTDIKCIDAQEFPPMPSPDLEAGIEINVTDLKEMIKQVVLPPPTMRPDPFSLAFWSLWKITRLRWQLLMDSGFLLEPQNCLHQCPLL